MAERREGERIQKSLLLQYAIVSDSGPAKWDMSSIKDISVKGVCVTMQKALETGTKLTLLLKIPFRPFDYIQAKGEVMDEEELKTVFDVTVAGMHLARIKFIDLKEDQKKLIDEYVHWFWDTYLKKDKLDKGKPQ